MIIEAILCVVFVIGSIIYAMQSLRNAQASGYKFVRVRGNAKFRLFELIIECVVFITIIILQFNHHLKIGIVFAILILHIIYYGNRYISIRTKYRFTFRGTRLFILVAILLTSAHLIINVYLEKPTISLLCEFGLMMLSRIVVLLACYILMPFEALNNMRYIRKAKDVLDKLSAIKIGITGSFGKTSCKHILTEMLSIKYKVIKTTKSYNTPLGICYSTLEVKGDEEIFIAEMGARNKGDVSKLCELVKPTYGIITGIGNQHYESFKTHQAIYDTKKELVDAIPPQGYVVFNGENKKACAMSCQCKSETAVVHMTKKEGIYAQNVKLTNAGSSFEIVGLGKPMAVTTRLLGRHNIINILMCAALAYRLGLTSRDIASAISKLSPVKHRLALVENSSLITIIDDSYNANFEGVGFALEVLSQFKGRKVVFTQGIVELGKLQVETNMMLGTMLANVADIVLLCGENSKAINNGLENARFQGEVYNCKSIEDAKTHFSSILKANDTLLIQNDIP